MLPEPGPYANADLALQDELVAAVELADAAMDRIDFAGALAAAKNFVDAVNMYVTEQEPWKLAKDDANAVRLRTVLYTMCEALRAIAILHNPVMPKSMSLLWARLGATPHLGPIGEATVASAAHWGMLPPGAMDTKGDSLFPRIEEETK